MKKILIAVFFVLPLASFAQVPDFPMAFWGEVTIDDTAAPAGTIVKVYDETTKVGEVVVQESGVYGYTEPTKQKLILGEGVGLLAFKIESSSVNGGNETGGITPVTHTGFVSGETVELDLVFDVVDETVSSGGSSSSSGGGGGGGGSRKVDTPSETVLGIATSTENMTEEELKIELQKQIIVLLTQLIALLRVQLGV